MNIRYKVVNNEIAKANNERVKALLISNKSKRKIRLELKNKGYNGDRTETGFDAIKWAEWYTVGNSDKVDDLNNAIKNSIKQGKNKINVEACYTLASKRARWLVYKLACVDKSKRAVWQNTNGIDELTQIGVCAILENATDIRNGKTTASKAVGSAIAKAVNPNRHYSDILIFKDTSDNLAYARKVIRETTNCEFDILELKTTDNDEIKALIKLLEKNNCKQALKVFALIGYGYTNKEIAKKLKISEKTVAQHTRTILNYALQVK